MNTSNALSPAQGTARSDARADTTRAALLHAGITLFGRDGFAATSLRDLAREANVNQALISYHFGGKQGLYLAVFDHIGAHLAARLGTVPQELNARLQSLPSNPVAARELGVDGACRLVTTVAALLMRPEMTPYARLIIREQMDPGAAFERLYQGAVGQVAGTLTRLVAAADGRARANDSHRLMAMTLLGQALVFRVARATVAHQLGWHGDYTPRRIRRITALLHANVRRLLLHPN